MRNRRMIHKDDITYKQLLRLQVEVSKANIKVNSIRNRLDFTAEEAAKMIRRKMEGGNRH